MQSNHRDDYIISQKCRQNNKIRSAMNFNLYYDEVICCVFSIFFSLSQSLRQPVVGRLTHEQDYEKFSTHKDEKRERESE